MGSTARIIHYLRGLLDVTFSGSPADNDVVAYDSATSRFKNQTAAEAGLATANHTHISSQITDATPDAQSDKILKRDAFRAGSLAQLTLDTGHGVGGGGLIIGGAVFYEDDDGTLTTTSNILTSGGMFATAFGGDGGSLNNVNAITLNGAIADNSANNLVLLDGSGKLPSSVIPSLAIAEPFVVVSQAAMLALAAQKGDVAIRTDVGKSFILSSNSPGTLADWVEIRAAGAVTSVNSQTGTVVLTTTNVSEGSNLYFTNVRAVSACAATYAPIASPTFTGPVTSTGSLTVTGALSAIPAGVVRSDTFNRADSSSSVGTPSDGGSAWAATGTWGIAANRCYSVSGAEATLLLESGVADGTIQATYSVAATDSGFVFRATDTNNFHLMLLIGAAVYAYKRVAGSYSSNGGPFTVAAGDVLKVITAGSSITMYRNGVSFHAYSDGFNQEATQHGFRANGDSTVRFDDFSVAGGATVGVLGTAPSARQTVTGARGTDAALASLLTKLATKGLITDGTVADGGFVPLLGASLGNMIGYRLVYDNVTGEEVGKTPVYDNIFVV